MSDCEVEAMENMMAREQAENDMKCQGCGKEGAVRKRQKTAYVKDEMNFATLCPECQERNDEYWQESWDEYYAGCM